MASSSSNGGRALPQPFAAADDEEITAGEQQDGGGVRPATAALAQLTATLREAKRGTHFSGKGKNNPRSDVKVDVRSDLLKAANRLTNRSRTVSRERALKVVVDRKKRYTHSPGCNTRRAANRCSSMDDSVAKSVGIVLRQVMMDVDIQHKDDSIGNQMFSLVLGSAHGVIEDLRQELAKHRSEALHFYHGAGRAEQEIEALKNTKESYLETGRKRIAEKHIQDLAWQESSASMKERCIKAEAHRDHEEHLVKSQREIIEELKKSEVSAEAR